MAKLKEYRVVWEIDCSAYSAQEAALYALKAMRDPTSSATYLVVKDKDTMQEMACVDFGDASEVEGFTKRDTGEVNDG